MAIADILIIVGLLGAVFLGGLSLMRRRSEAEFAAMRALRENTPRAIDDALAFHKMPRKIRKHLERRRAELLADEVLEQ